MKKKYSLEVTEAGYANGLSLQLAEKQKRSGMLDIHLVDSEKFEIINKAADAFGQFLDALGCDWRNDPNSSDTPRRVAKAYVNDLWAGRFNAPPEITAFPSDGYDGLVQESNIPLTSMCSHHHQTIQGRVSVAYIPGKEGMVIGLSKLNRIVEYFGRRGAIQEQLTVAIHQAIDKICEGNRGVAVVVKAQHTCACNRGVKHHGCAMITSKLTGDFMKDEKTRSEFYKFVDMWDRHNN